LHAVLDKHRIALRLLRCRSIKGSKPRHAAVRIGRQVFAEVPLDLVKDLVALASVKYVIGGQSQRNPVYGVPPIQVQLVLGAGAGVDIEIPLDPIKQTDALAWISGTDVDGVVAGNGVDVHRAAGNHGPVAGVVIGSHGPLGGFHRNRVIGVTGVD